MLTISPSARAGSRDFTPQKQETGAWRDWMEDANKLSVMHRMDREKVVARAIKNYQQTLPNTAALSRDTRRILTC